MGIFTADHVIRPVDKFSEAVQLAFETAKANPQALIPIGITVRAPETAFGYVRRGEKFAEGVYRVDGFTEKPNADLAGRYAASGDYYWNSGMFAWRTGAILGELRVNLPESFEGVMEIAKAWNTPQRSEKLNSIYPTLKRISIDYAVMEHARDVLVVEMNCRWADVGSWTQLSEVLTPDQDGNVVAARRAYNHGSSGVTIVSEDDDHVIATVGVRDLTIVHSGDATLVCQKSDAQVIKDLLAEIEAEHGERYS